MRIALVMLIALLFKPVAVSAGEGYPDFSWDRVSLYAHLGAGDGLEPAQTNFLADHFSIIAFTGGRVTRGTSVEPNIAAAARAIKQRNPKAKVLFYWSSDIPKHQWMISNASFPENGYVRPAVKTAKGTKGTHSFDVTKPEVRDWWTDIAAKAVHEYSCDGIFVDGATAGTPGGVWSRVFGEEKAARLEEGMFTMLREAKAKMGDDKLIIFNPLHGHDGTRALGEDYLPVTDGAMVDDFDRAANVRQQSKEYMAGTIEIMRKASKAGKIVIFKAWPGFTWWSDPELMKKPHEEQYRAARKAITFPLACFLVGAGENCYFAIPGVGLASMARSTGIRSSTGRSARRRARLSEKAGPTSENSNTPRCLLIWRKRRPR